MKVYETQQPDGFKEASESHNAQESVARMRQLVNQLPWDNKLILEYLINFIGRVAEHSEKNFMHIQNLATVFGPNLLRPKNATAIEMMGHTAVICGIVELLIAKREDIFVVRSIILVKFLASANRTVFCLKDVKAEKATRTAAAENTTPAVPAASSAGIAYDEFGKPLYPEGFNLTQELAEKRIRDCTSSLLFNNAAQFIQRPVH